MTPGAGGLPGGRRGQALAGLLALMVVAVVWLAVAAPLHDLYAGRAERVAEQREKLTHLARLAAVLPALRQAATTTAPGGPPPAALLSGETDAIAGAALQGMVQDMATAAGATLASAEALPSEQQGGFRRIALRIALSGDWSVLMAMLRAVESSQYRLLVDDVQLHAAARLQAGPAAALAPPPIDASFVVMGFRPGHEAGPQHADLRAEATPQAR